MTVLRLLIALTAAVDVTAVPIAARDAPAYEKDEVKALPGWDEALPSRHFSGYLQASPTKRLHYYLVQSEGDWNKDPVVLWFNGGPGCSSLDGFLYEHGPFRVQYDGKEASLARFDYAWSKLATMVYIEAPCGVGFSYSTAKDTTRDYNATDDTAALDNLAAVESLFDKFPKLKSRDLYITGESYAGIYVPTLAEAIVAKGAAYTGATLKGIAVGNGCSGSEIGICAFGRSTQGSFYTTKFLLSSGFAPETLKDELREACAADFSTWAEGGPVSEGCAAKVDELGALTKDLDTYCVLTPASIYSPGHRGDGVGSVRHHLSTRLVNRRCIATVPRNPIPSTTMTTRSAARCTSTTRRRRSGPQPASIRTRRAPT